jgi:hypothetical protein
VLKRYQKAVVHRLRNARGMASERIGTVKSGKGKTYEVFWDHASKDVYVSYGGKSRCGRANSAAEAMRIAEAWLYDK